MKTGHRVVLLHGWASHPHVFRGLTRVLEKNFSVQVMALPGCGESAPCTPYTLERIADTLATAAPKQCSVVGWSLGAQVALMWAQRAPKQVHRLVLIGATPCFMQRTDWDHAVTPVAMRQFTSAIKRDLPSVLRRFIALQSLGDTQAVRVAHKLRTVLFTNLLPTQHVLEAGLDILRKADLRAMLPSIAQPALVIHGEHDAVTPCAAGQALTEALPHARFHKIAGAAHAPFLSDPNAVALLLHEFLDESIATV
ncbi:MAG: pimeloyl-ACP methyl ester esterase BioH [Burkholderiales bacterium]